MGDTFTALNYHIVFSTKDRRPVLTDTVHAYLGGCFRELGAVPIEIGGVSDHVHGIVRLKPTHCLSDVMRDVKRASSLWVHQRIADFHWQDGYAAFTVSPSQVDRVRNYIRGQPEHHRQRPFADELRELLEANGIEYDPRYLL